MVTIICSECGVGHYYSGRTVGGRAIWAMCDECGHEVSASDLVTDEGETLTWDDEGRLAYEEGDEEGDPFGRYIDARIARWQD